MPLDRNLKLGTHQGSHAILVVQRYQKLLDCCYYLLCDIVCSPSVHMMVGSDSWCCCKNMSCASAILSVGVG